MRSYQKRLLETYLEEALLKEEYTSKEGLKKIFLDPFLDVFKVAKGKAMEMHQRVYAAARVAYNIIGTTLIPWLRDDFDSIFAEEKEKLKEIRSKYSEVYAKTWAAFNNNDFIVTAFMLAPTAFLTKEFFMRIPGQSLNFMSWLTNGRYDDWFMKVRDNVSSMGFQGSGDRKAQTKKKLSAAFGESVNRISEATSSPDPKEWLAEKLTSDKLLAKVKQSHRVKELEGQGKALVTSTMENLIKHAEAILKSTSFDELSKAIGKKIPFEDKLKSIPPEQKAEVEKKLLESTREAMKNMYVQGLEKRVKDAIAQGCPKNHPLVDVYRQVISKIKSM